MPERKTSYAREGEPSQRTKAGLIIPVPTRRSFMGSLRKAAKGKPKRKITKK